MSDLSTVSETTAPPAAPAPRVIPCSEWGAIAPKQPIVPAGAPVRSIYHGTDGLAGGPGFEAARDYARSLQKDHMFNPKKLWIDSGHNFLIMRTGHIFEGRHGSLNAITQGKMVSSAHCPGQNGQPGVEHEHKGTQTLTDAQKSASIWLHTFICRKTGIKPADIRPHREFLSTDCPTPALMQWLPELRAAVERELQGGGSGTTAAGYDARSTVDLNLRQGPSTSAPVLRVLSPGTLVHVRRPAAADPRWCEVQLPLGGATGFAARSFLTPLTPGAPVTPESTVIAANRVGEAGVVSYLLARGSHSTAGYTQTDVKNIVAYYGKACRKGDVDLLLACAQMTHETAALSSDRARRPECNPAGIGVTAAGQPGVVFGSWQAAVPAHVGRLLAYALPEGAGTAEQRELVTIALSARGLDDSLRGTAPTLAGLSAHWSNPDKLASLANEIRTT